MISTNKCQNVIVVFLVYFRSFSNKQYNFNNKSLYTYSIWCQDLNPRPLKHESSPINTLPGLQPIVVFLAIANSKLERRTDEEIFEIRVIADA